MDQTKTSFLAFVLITLLLAGCATATVPMAPNDLEAHSKLFKPKNDGASVYIYRPDESQAVPYNVYMNDKNIGQLSANSYFYFNLRPGDYSFKGSWTAILDSETETSPPINLNLKVGKLYFLTLSRKNAFQLEEISENIGRNLIAGSRMAASVISNYESYMVGTNSGNSESAELVFWNSIKDSMDPQEFQSYIQKYPTGNFVSIAQSRIEKLTVIASRISHAEQHPPIANGKLKLGDFRALVIGINNYQMLPKLETAVNDAKAVASMLKDGYGFKVTLLLDANRKQMLDAFDDLRRSLGENDNLLVYYAGHGYLDTDADRGFWMPVDAEENHRSNWISNSDLTDMAKATQARHILIVSDSCYAGTLTRNLSISTKSLEDISRLAQKRARTALVSGGLEPVEDAGGNGHSVFTKAFLDALKANTGTVNMSELFPSIRRQVILNAQQTPQYGDIRQTGHEGGDFIFARQN